MVSVDVKEVSDYVKVQLIEGKTPGEKQKNINLIANEIVNNENELKVFLNTGETTKVHHSLKPYLKILIGERIKSNEIILEALKSQQGLIVKLALSSKFFFGPTNPLIEPQLFISNLIPYISLRTRRELIKTLGRKLTPCLADKFYKSFIEVLPIQQVIPLLNACSAKFIQETFLGDNNFDLPIRILNNLFLKYPKFVIQYLKSKPRETIFRLYVNLLPVLIKKYTSDFIEIYEKLMENQNNRCTTFQNLRLNNTRSKFLLKNAPNALVEKPNLYLEVVPLKLISYKLLNINQFEKWFRNLFFILHDDLEVEYIFKSSFSIYGNHCLKYYPQEKRLTLLNDVLKSRLNKDLFEIEYNILKDTFINNLIPDTHLKKKIGEKYIKSALDNKKNKSWIDNHLFYLPPDESIPKLKELIKTENDGMKRTEYIVQMIKSCVIYNKEDKLLEVLRYYNNRHTNEKTNTAEDVLREIPFDLLNKKHLKETLTMIQKEYMKDNMLSFYVSEIIFENLLKVIFQKKFSDSINDEDENNNMNLLINIVLKDYLEKKHRWGLGKTCADLPEKCVLKFLSVLKSKYDNSNEIWKNLSNKLDMSYELLIAIHGKKISCKKANSDSEEVTKSWSLESPNLCQLKDFAESLLEVDPMSLKKKDARKLKKFHNLVRVHDQIWYQSWIDQGPNRCNRVNSPDALKILKYDYQKILDKWNRYLEECKKSLSQGSSSDIKFTTQFIAKSKWYDGIPVRFINECLKDVKENIRILAVLLDGDKFCELTKNCSPVPINFTGEDDKTFKFLMEFMKAVIHVHDPTALSMILPFCHGIYISTARGTAFSVAERTSLDNILKLLESLQNMPISSQKIILQIIFKSSMKNQLGETLNKYLRNEKNSGVRKIIINETLNLFKELPDDNSWLLVQTAVDSLTVGDENIINAFAEVQRIPVRYLPKYTEKFILKLDSFEPDTKIDKINLMETFIANLSEYHPYFIKDFPENLLETITTRIIMDNLKSGRDFLASQYLSPKFDKFQFRLNKFIEVFGIKMITCKKDDTGLFEQWKFKILEFTKEFLNLLQKHKNEARNQILEKILSIFQSQYEACNFPHMYLLLKLFEDFFESKEDLTAREWGIKYGKRLKDIVNEISSENYLKEISYFIHNQDFFKISSSPSMQRRHTDVLDLIEGLMESDKNYGSMLGIYILNEYPTWFFSDISNSKFKSMYEGFIKIWNEHENRSVRAILNLHLYKISSYGFY